MGRFINADVFASTGQGIVGNNMFAYCNNNPIGCRDQDGCAPSVSTTDEGYYDDWDPLISALAAMTIGPINGQKLGTNRDKPYGASTVGEAGCEAIACYITLYFPKKYRSLNEVIGDFESRFFTHFLTGSGFCCFGLLGASPHDIDSYISDCGIQYESFSCLCQADQYTAPGIFIISYRIGSNTIRYHTISVVYDGVSFVGYNVFDEVNHPILKDSLLGFVVDERRFIHGLYIPYP